MGTPETLYVHDDCWKGEVMQDMKTPEHQGHFSCFNSDPLGINGIALGGDPPSLRVEACIAARQWAIQNGSTGTGKADERSQGKT